MLRRLTAPRTAETVKLTIQKTDNIAKENKKM